MKRSKQLLIVTAIVVALAGLAFAQQGGQGTNQAVAQSTNTMPMTQCACGHMHNVHATTPEKAKPEPKKNSKPAATDESPAPQNVIEYFGG